MENLIVTDIVENLHYLSIDELDVIANHIEKEKSDKKRQAQRNRINKAIEALEALQIDMDYFVAGVEVPVNANTSRWADLPVYINSLLEGLEALR